MSEEINKKPEAPEEKDKKRKAPDSAPFGATGEDMIAVQSDSLKMHKKGIEQELVPLAERTSHSDFDITIMVQLLEGKYKNMWLGEPLQKDPISLQLYLTLMQQLKPGTIFDLGTFGGGSALWFGAQAKALGLDSKVVTFDIHDYRTETCKKTMEKMDNVVVVHGDLYKGAEVLGEEMKKNPMPHPWLIAEDCHVDAKVIMDAFLGAGMAKGDYVLYEDTHPLHVGDYRCWADGKFNIPMYKEIMSSKGDTWAQDKLDRALEVMRDLGDSFAVDAGIQDMFGYNGCTFINSVFAKVK